MENEATGKSSRKRYRRYFFDSSVSVPRSTLCRWRQRDDCTSLCVDTEVPSNEFAIDEFSDEEEPHGDLEDITNSEDDRLISMEEELENDAEPLSACCTDDYSDCSSDDMDTCCSEDFNNDDHSSYSSDEHSSDNDAEQWYDANFDLTTFHRTSLYEGTDITITVAMCLIMQFVSSNNLSNDAIEKLLKLLNQLLPIPNHLPMSFYKFKKFFEQFSVPYKYSEVCATCSNCKDECDCGSKAQAIGHLVHISLVKPLSAILTKHWESLQFSSCNRERTLTDAWDGSFLSNNDDNTIALLASTDGIPLFKSSNVSLWPVSFVILNLPPAIRMYSENIILAGFWIGCKPPMKLLFDPILKNLSSLATSGLKIAAPTTTCTVYIQLVLATFDLPAKAAVLAAKQFNGKYGCSVCLHPGLRLPNNTRIYLPLQYRERTHCEVVEQGKKAERKGIAVKGIMGTSSLTTVLDLVDAVPVDYMHTVLLGIVKMLLTRWFDTSYHRKPFYLGRHAVNIDATLLKQRPPSEFTRRPRSIKSHLKYWKASELRNWLLYYSLPLLVDHLPSLYWHHYALLVSAVHILLGDNIAQSSIDIAHQMLCDFYLLVPELYGETMCTHNMHLLTHLAKFVRLWGPLWTHSTFGFESKNGQLKKFFHSRNIIYQQLVFNSDAIVTLQFLRAQIFEHNPELSVKLDIGKKKVHSNMVCIDEHCYRVGASFMMLLSTDQKLAINREDQNDPFECFYRLFKEGEMFHCSLSQENGARNDTVCFFKQGDVILFGTISLFILKPSPVALINIRNPKPTSLLHQADEPCKDTLNAYKNIDLLKKYIIPIESGSSSLISVDVKCICRKGVLIETDTGMYIVAQPNIYERH